MTVETNTTVASDPTGQGSGVAGAGGSTVLGTPETTTPKEGETVLGASDGDKPEVKKVDEVAPAKSGDGDSAELKIVLPEGVVADPDTMKWFEESAKKSGLNSEQANTLAAGYVELQKKQSEALDAQKRGWEKELKDNPEIGGAKWAESQQTALTAVRRFAPQGFIDLLNETGLGSHPDVVATFIAIGNATKEDNNAGSTGGGGGPATEKDLNDIRFPSSARK